MNVCNKNKKQCKNKIFIITKNTSDFAKKKGSYYVTISTDILFKNAMNKLCTEKHKPSPYNYYGKLKFSAEKYVTKTNKNSLIIRTRFFGLHSKKNFFSNILSLSQKEREFNGRTSRETGIRTLVEKISMPLEIEEIGLRCDQKMWGCRRVCESRRSHPISKFLVRNKKTRL